MNIQVSNLEWEIETQEDGLKKYSGIEVKGSFVDKAHALDMDERDNLEALVELPDMPKVPQSLRAQRILARERKLEEKAAQQRAYMKRQQQVNDAINAHIDLELASLETLDLNPYGPPQRVELNKNRKSRKVSFIRRYPHK